MIKMIGVNIQEAVAKRNITNIRSALKGCMNQDVNFSKGIYEEALDYVLNNGISKQELFQVHDEEPFKSQEAWDKDYLDEVMADLLFNFSEERIAHTKEVGRVLYPVQKKINQPNGSQSNSSQPNSNQSQKVGGKSYFPLLAGVVVSISVVVLLLLQIVKK